MKTTKPVSPKPLSPRDVRKELAILCEIAKAYIEFIDSEMKKPSTSDRGHRVALATNKLEMAVDHARYFGLGIDFRDDLKAKSLTPTTPARPE